MMMIMMMMMMMTMTTTTTTIGLIVRTATFWTRKIYNKHLKVKVLFQRKRRISLTNSSVLKLLREIIAVVSWESKESAQVLNNEVFFVSVVITVFWWITWKMIRAVLSTDETKTERALMPKALLEHTLRWKSP
jgi:ABC-type multidrug transport system fused ATPase/permease subunit